MHVHILYKLLKIIVLLSVDILILNLFHDKNRELSALFTRCGFQTSRFIIASILLSVAQFLSF